MNPAAKPAVSPRDDVLATDYARILDEAISDDFRMFQHIGRVAYDPGDQNLPLWQLGYVAPNLPFVFVAHIAGLQRIRLRVHFNQQINDVLEGNIALVRAMPAPPTNVKPNAIFWNTLSEHDLPLRLETPPTFGIRLYRP
jgi:hypothetical protein